MHGRRRRHKVPAVGGEGASHPYANAAPWGGSSKARWALRPCPQRSAATPPAEHAGRAAAPRRHPVRPTLRMQPAERICRGDGRSSARTRARNPCPRFSGRRRGPSAVSATTAGAVSGFLRRRCGHAPGCGTPTAIPWAEPAGQSAPSHRRPRRWERGSGSAAGRLRVEAGVRSLWGGALGPRSPARGRPRSLQRSARDGRPPWPRQGARGRKRASPTEPAGAQPARTPRNGPKRR